MLDRVASIEKVTSETLLMQILQLSIDLSACIHPQLQQQRNKKALLLLFFLQNWSIHFKFCERFHVDNW